MAATAPHEYEDLIVGLGLPPLGHTRSATALGRRDPLNPERICGDGQRTEQLTRLAGMWLGQGIPVDQVVGRCLTWNQSKCVPPLDDSKVISTVESIARTDERNHPKDTPGTGSPHSPLFDLASARASRFADDPPRRTWLLDEFLPLGKVGTVVATGGTGKSMFALQLAMSVATGSSFMRWKVPAAGGVLVLAAEDDEDELHRRVHAIGASMCLSPASWGLVDRHLYVKSMVAENNLMTCATRSGAIEQTVYVDRLLLVTDQIEDLKLIITDPASRFRGGDENTAQDATRYVEQLERLAQATGATVLVLHHTNKGAYNADEQSQNAARGSSAFSDGVRWQVNIRAPSPKEADGYGLDKDKRKSFVVVANTKNNYGALADDVLLFRTEGGVLAPYQHGGMRPSVSQQIYDFIQAEAARGKTYSANTLEGAIAGQNGTLNVGITNFRACIRDGIKSGYWQKVGTTLAVTGIRPS